MSVRPVLIKMSLLLLTAVLALGASPLAPSPEDAVNAAPRQQAVDPVAFARSYLREQAGALGLSADAADLEVVRSTTSLAADHVTFQQVLNGAPVEGALVQVHLATKEQKPQVLAVQNFYQAGLSAPPEAAKLTAGEAYRYAYVGLAGEPRPIGEAKQVYFLTKEGPRLTWQVSVFTPEPLGEWRSFVDAATGTVLEQVNVVRTGGPSAGPSPAPPIQGSAPVEFVSGRFLSGALSGRQVEVPFGAAVDVFVTLRASAATSGTIRLEVRKDVATGLDEVQTTCDLPQTLAAGMQEVRVCRFIPPLPTGGTLRQYYFHVLWNGALIHSPTDRATREFLRVAGGMVFDPNPIVQANNPDLAGSTTDANSPELAGLRVIRPLLGLDSSGKLRGPFVDLTAPGIIGAVKPAGQADEPGHGYLFNRDDDRFEEVMVYHHVDRTQRYIQSLGFTNVNNRAIAVHAHFMAAANAFYSSGNRSLHFGDNGSRADTAEDGDVIVHEYGHAVLDDQAPDLSSAGEGDALHEGFADYLAAAMSASPGGTGTVGPECIAEWFTKSQGRRCLRDLTSTKHYPEDLTGSPHADGELWSATLWQLRRAIGAETFDRIVLESHFFYGPRTQFQDAVLALLLAEQGLHQGRFREAIRSAFVARGILRDVATSSHRLDTVAFNWIDAVTDGTVVAQGDDVSTPVDLGFTFTFSGTAYTRVHVSSNGVLSFSGPFTAFRNACLNGPGAQAPADRIYALWDDLFPTGGANGNVFAKRTGPQQFVVTWNNVAFFSSAGRSTFQVVLNGDGAFTIQHRDATRTSATLGMTNRGGEFATQISCNGGGRLVDAATRATPAAVTPTASAATFQWNDISSSGAVIAQGDDVVQEVPLLFPFQFFGNTYRSMFVSSNGVITFDQGSGAFFNTCLPTAIPPNNAIYAYWDDLFPTGGSNGNVFHLGTASEHIIQWNNVRFFGSRPGTVSFQVILRPDNTAKIQYLTAQGGVSATAGIEDRTGLSALQLFCNPSTPSTRLADSTAFLVTTHPTAAVNLSISPAEQVVAVGATFSADIVINPVGSTMDRVEAFLNFNPAVVQVVDSDPNTAGIQVQPGTVLPQVITNTVSNSAGTIDFVATASSGQGAGTTFAIARVQFRGLVASPAVELLSFARTPPRNTAVKLANAPIPLGQVLAGAVRVVGPPSRIAVANFRDAVAGAAQTITVAAQDVAGNVTPEYRGTVRFTSNDPLALLPADATFTAADNGQKSVSVTLRTAGSQKAVTVADVNMPSLTGSSDRATVSPAGATRLEVSGLAEGPVGVSQAITVSARDTFSNIASGYRGTVRFNSSGSTAVLPADYTFVAADAGRQNFSVTLTTLSQSATVIVTDTSNATITGAAGPVRVRPAAVAAFGVSPRSLEVGINRIFTVDIVTDASQQPIDDADVFISFNSAFLRVVDSNGAEAASITPGPILQAGGAWAGGLRENAVSGGEVTFRAQRGQGPAANQVFTLATIRFKAIAATSTAPVQFSTTSPRVTRATSRGVDVTGALTDGAVTVQALSIAAVSPSRGPQSGGTAVTITGTGLVPGATVSFGGTGATEVNVADAGAITARAPSHTPGQVDVVVANPDGQRASLPNGFTFVAAPSIASVTPSRGPASGGTTITISGAGFAAGATLFVGGTAATDVRRLDASTMTAVTPPHTPGVVDVTVTNTDGQAGTLGNGFTFEAPTSRSTSFNPTTVNLLDAGSFVTVTADALGLDPGTDAVQLNIQHPSFLSVTSPRCAGVFSAGTVIVPAGVAGGTLVGCFLVSGNVSGTSGPVMDFVLTRTGPGAGNVTPLTGGAFGTQYSDGGGALSPGTTNVLQVSQNAAATAFDPTSLSLALGGSTTISVVATRVSLGADALQVNVQHSNAFTVTRPQCAGMFAGGTVTSPAATGGGTLIGCFLQSGNVSATSGAVMTFVLTRTGPGAAAITFGVGGSFGTQYSDGGSAIGPGNTGALQVTEGIVVQGRVLLQGRQTDFPAGVGHGIAVVSLSSGNLTASVAGNGDFVFQDVPSGTFTLTATAPGYMSGERLGVVVVGTSPVTLPVVVLGCGLVNNDSAVNIQDISATVAAFGTSPPNRVDGQGRFVDQNGDGGVSILDISCVVSGFGRTSPQPWGDPPAGAGGTLPSSPLRRTSRVLPSPLGNQGPPQAPAAAAVVVQHHVEGELTVMPVHPTEKAQEVLRTAPVLAGRMDLSGSHVQRGESRLPGSQLGVVDRVGRLPMVGRPDTMNRVIHDFLAGEVEPIEGVSRA